MKAIKTPLSFKNGVIETTDDMNVITQQKIIDVLVTSPGERVMRPNYGAGAYNLLFDVMDPLVFSDFKTEALSDISDNVTGAAIVDMRVGPASEEYDETSLVVTAYYQIPPSTVTSVDILVGAPSLSEDEF